MKHLFKVILATALTLVLALSMFALADGEVLEVEEQVEEQAEAVEATPVEDVDEVPAEIEAELPELDEEAPVDEEPAEAEGDDGETSSVSPVGDPPSPEGKAEGDQPVEEEPAAEEPVEEESVEESADEQPADGEAADEQPTDGEPVEEALAEEQPAAKALTYNGEAQALVEAVEGWIYSLDGEVYAIDPPAATDAGEYTVYCAPADDPEAMPIVLTATIAKAEVTLTPPVAFNAEG